MNDLPDLLRRGEPARLIPVIADSRKEQRAASVLLAVLAAVDEFGKGVLRAIGAPVGKTSNITCFTEVVFKAQPKDTALRPDGLIVVRTGKKVWSAIVEAKIGNATLDAEQIEKYLNIARLVHADALITLSNQFATLPTHHPVSINQKKLKTIGLYHWSWTFILTEAILCESRRGVADPDQAFILRELIRYLDHDSSGVTAFDRMPTSWKELCAHVQQGVRLSRNTPGIADNVVSWHELTRYLALNLSVELGSSVTVYLSKAHAKEANDRLQHDAAHLSSEAKLSATFDVPGAASRIALRADLARRTVTASMTLRAPQDIVQTRTAVTWIFKQVDKCPDDGLIIVAKWPGRLPDTMAPLGALREDRQVLLQPSGSHIVAFEVRRVSDLGGRFRGAKTFVEDVQRALSTFYDQAGQHLKAWAAKPPKPKPLPDYMGKKDDGDNEAHDNSYDDAARQAQPTPRRPEEPRE